MKPSIPLLAAGLFWVCAAGLPAQTKTEIEYLHPFSHTALIPANVDVASIRLSGIKLVKVPTEIKITTDEDYCKQASEGDPGGSMFCPEVEAAAFERAYRVTYSYTGPPLASDEHGDTRFTFSIYFRPEELDAVQRKALAEKKPGLAAEYFEMTESRGVQKRIVIHEAASTFCEGNYIDGNWTHIDPGCEDKVAFKLITQPSDYLTVSLRVER